MLSETIWSTAKRFLQERLLTLCKIIYRKAFCNFDTESVAQMTDEDVERLMQQEGIVRNRLKIKSTITNAKLFLATLKEFGSFYNYTLSFFRDSRNLVGMHFMQLFVMPYTDVRSLWMVYMMSGKFSSVKIYIAL